MIAAMLPPLFALAGTLLFAIVIFAPRRPLPAAPAVSFAPPLPPSPPVFESWTPPPVVEPSAAPLPAWPLLVDRAAENLTAAERYALIEALDAVRAPWADAILAAAAEEDPDDGVRRSATARSVR